ncbi:MAG: lytic transglycosylase domain-containing protein [Rhodospirillales bacterium]|nr:lytic transglycosylase domain-containing protein [Rhodospirillales bacterium]
MRRRPALRLCLLLLGLGLAAFGPAGRAARAEPMRQPHLPPAPRLLIPGLAAGPGFGDPSGLCRAAIATVERGSGIPPQLMAAIAHVESGRPDGRGGVQPWPWTINAEGEGHYYASESEAIAAVRALQARGVRSIDVGCMQVNLMHHPNAFGTLEQAFDPLANARYAARFLNQLYAQTGSWPQATADYHSATPALGADYQRKVAAVWPQERQAGGGGNVWTGNVWSTNVWNARGPAWPQPGAIKAPAPLTAGAYGGGYMLSNGARNARIIPAAPGAVGRGLAAYRAAPVALASQIRR